MTTAEYRVRIPAPAAVVFAWHARPGAFDRLAPPWESVRVLEQSGGIEDGRVVLQAGIGPVKVRWVAQHKDFIPGRQFRDVQLSGPFARWEHTHLVTPDGPEACWLTDHIEYELRGGALGRALAGGVVRAKLDAMFAYRHGIALQDIAAHAAIVGGKPMKVAITGSTGLIGKALSAFLTTGGHEVVPVVRGQARPGQIAWDPQARKIDAGALEGIDAVIHLAGESLAQGRWNAAKKARIHDSRVKGTAFLADVLAGLKRGPRVLVSTSAIGYYGNRGDTLLDEESAAGQGFLADVCRGWEAATRPAELAGIRVARIRLGIVLTPAGGALAKLLTPFKLGAGGIVGNGRQYWSWITLDDAVGAIHHALMHPEAAGPINAVAPDAPTNAAFTKALGKVLGRPTIFPLPAFMARLALGEMADELLLSSQRVRPARLLAGGYAFRYPELEPALRHLLGKNASR